VLSIGLRFPLKSRTSQTETQENVSTGDVPFVDSSVPITTGNEIIAFSTVETPLVETVPARQDIDEVVLGNFLEGRDHTIIDVLSREYQFADLTIPVGGAAGDILATWDVTSLFLAQTNVRNKISGFAYFRADLEVRLEFTTLPTVAGGIMLSFYPDVNDALLTNRITSVLKLSQVPNLQSSLTTAESLKIRVPWISPLYARDLVTGTGRNGTVYLSRLTPSSTSEVSVRAYVRAESESIKLQYPTTGTLLTSFDAIKADISTHVEKMKDMDDELYQRLRSLLPKTQVHKVKKAHKKSVITPSATKQPESKSMESDGIVSTVLKTGSKIATLCEGIPVIGGVAAAAAPLLSIGAKLAGLFGLSKPLSDSPVRAIKFKPADAHLTNEGVLPAHQFSLNMNTTVSGADNPFGSEADEMATAAVMQTPNIIDVFTVSTAQAPRTILASYRLNLAQYNIIGDSTDNTIEQTHQMWMSNLAMQWLGDLNYEFDAYLTHFHRVKLRFIILPNVYDTFTVGTVLDSAYDINLASSSVIEFSGDNVNYSVMVSPRLTGAMKQVPSTRTFGAGPVPINSLSVLGNSQQTVNTSYGTLLVLIEVPLKASESVASSINFVTSFFAENVALSYPATDLQFLPQTQSKNTLGTSFEKPTRSERMLAGSSGVTSNSVNVDIEKNVEVCAGDTIMHFKNLLNAYNVFHKDVAVNLNNLYIITPHVVRHLATDVVNGNIDLFDYVMTGYAFRKGGMNVRLVSDSSANYAYRIALNNNYRAAWDGAVAPTGIGFRTASSAIVAPGTRAVPVLVSEGAPDYNVPYYLPFHMRAQHNIGTIETYGSAWENSLILNPSLSFNLMSWRAVADDFRAGFLLGLPNFVVNQQRAMAVTVTSAVADIAPSNTLNVPGTPVRSRSRSPSNRGGGRIESTGLHRNPQIMVTPAANHPESRRELGYE